MIIRLLCLFLSIFISGEPSSRPSPLENQKTRAKLRVRVQAYSLEATSFVEGLVRVASDFKIPMGVQWLETEEAKKRIALSWKDATVQDILNAVVETQPGYRVRVTGDIVHIYCPQLVPDRQNFLRLKVRQFEMKEVPVEMASRKLREIIMVSVSTPRANKTRQHGGVAGSLLGDVGDPKITVRLNNTTVRDVLDALALASTRKIWVTTFQRDPTPTSTGLRRTHTLWNDSPIPDEEQPVWDMFRWGDPVPPRKGSTEKLKGGG